MEKGNEELFIENLEEKGDKIIEVIEEEYLNNCQVIVETWEGGADLNVENDLDYEQLIKDTIKEHTKGMSQDEIDYITDYVNDNVLSEDDLCEQAMEDYRERDYNPY